MLLHITGGQCNGAVYKYGERGQNINLAGYQKMKIVQEKNSGKVARRSDNLVITGTSSVTSAHF